MAAPQPTHISKVGGFNVFFLLFLLPLGFSYGVHYILAKHYMFERELTVIKQGDVEQVLKKIADFQSVKPLLPLYSPELQIKAISKTNEAFNISVPLIGNVEVRYVKSKEEMMRPDSQTKIVSAGYNLVADDFEVSYMIQAEQKNQVKDYKLTLKAEIFGRTQFARSIVGVFAPIFESRTARLFEELQTRILA